MNVKQLFYIGLLFSAGLLNAQTDFRAGYLIKLNNDTLIGEIDYRGDLLMGKVCRFRAIDTRTEINYSPNDIIAYRFNEGKYYVSKEFNGNKVFVRFLIKGKINIYYLRDDTGGHYFLEKEDKGIIEIPYEEEIRYKDDVRYFYRSSKHIGILIYYMQDAPGFQTRIANMGKPEQENLIKLAQDYNNIVSKDEACVIYEKKLPALIFNIEIIAGIIQYQISGENIEKNYFQAGIVTHFWMPKVNEKLYFKTGFLYSTLPENNTRAGTFTFPIQIEYLYPRGNVQPILAFGINLYSPFYQSVAFAGGVRFKLDKSISLGINYNVDFNPDPKFQLLPKSLLSQSLTAGLIIRL